MTKTAKKVQEAAGSVLVESALKVKSASATKSKSESKTAKSNSAAENGGGGGVAGSPVLRGAGVIFLSHIPHGFYEDQMRAYFSQFGEITRLRMARNKRTGASRHYAYVEFRHEAVARIVADTMHNYLMFGRLLQCSLVPVDQVHPDTFVGANRKFKIIPWKKIAKERYNAPKTEEQTIELQKRNLKHIKSVEDRCRELGISWDARDL